MRVVFIGAGEETVLAARALIREGHDIVVIERERTRIDELRDRLDCSFVHGDGSRPEILREVGAGDTDVLFCLTDDDRSNILASLVGRHLGFRRVVTSLRDGDLEEICRGLGLQDTIVPDRTIARHLCDLVHGLGPLALSPVLKNEARLLAVKIPDDVSEVAGLELPSDVHALWLYRDGSYRAVAADTRLRKDDELVLLVHASGLRALIERFADRAGPPSLPVDDQAASS